MNRKSTSISGVLCLDGASLNLDRSRPHRLVVIGMVRSLYAVFVGLKPLFESDRGSCHLRIVQVVLSEKVRASLESGSAVPLLIVIPADPFDLILELPVV